jgi:hypothetical protein
LHELSNVVEAALVKALLLAAGRWHLLAKIATELESDSRGKKVDQAARDR